MSKRIAASHPHSSANPIATCSAEWTERLRRIVEHCRQYQRPHLGRSVGQATLSLGIYVGTVLLMILAAKGGLWFLSLLLAPLAAGILVKVFIIQHDCGHGAYFKNRRANDLLGRSLSVLTFTPYGFWRDAHNRHHASSGDLSRRGIGAVDTLTFEEYCALPAWRRLAYRLYRHPMVMIFFGAPVYFLILQRLPLTGPTPYSATYETWSGARGWRSVVALDAAMLAFYGGLVALLGGATVALVFLPIAILSAWAGAWLFFVQHQYEDAYWAEREEWNYAEAALLGSSHYDLPKFLHWLTGNIGLHHIHHLASRIPNYRLFECLRASEDLLKLPRLSLLESLRCARLALWDKAQRKMISFRALRRMHAAA